MFSYSSKLEILFSNALALKNKIELSKNNIMCGEESKYALQPPHSKLCVRFAQI